MDLKEYAANNHVPIIKDGGLDFIIALIKKADCKMILELGSAIGYSAIKMAKTQGLSLNPTKISGICGRLMCCLKYENDTYCQAKEGMPDAGEKIKTSDGILRVSEVDVLGNVIKARKIVKNIDAADEQLSDEVYTYEKEQVKRLGKKKGGKVKDEEMTEEMKELLKD